VATQPTRWSLVLKAGQADAAGRAALEELCAAYWQPVYALYRRAGVGREAASDLTQGLFADLLERGDLRRADPARGPFRVFLRACARNWLANERAKERAGKRGGGRLPLAIDAAGEEEWLRIEPVDRLDPEAVFERRWVRAVIDRALHRVQREETGAGRDAAFARLRAVLDGGPPPRPWAELAAELGTSEGALKVAAHRLRMRFRECLCAEVAETLPDGVQPGEELGELLRSLAAGSSTRNPPAGV
jgi:RNA polymerase sigma-70 factor (ECF subfamily)